MNDGLPDLELLEATHEFPCVFPFKAIGTTDEHFVGRVLAVVRQTLAADVEPAFSCRNTPSGRHVCVTIEPEVRDAEHVHLIYRGLQQVEGLVMLM